MEHYQLQLSFGLLGGFIGCVESLVDMWWSVGIQLTWCFAHQACRLAHVGIKKEPPTSKHTLILFISCGLKNNNCISLYVIYHRIRCSWVSLGRSMKSMDVLMNARVLYCTWGMGWFHSKLYLEILPKSY